MSVCVYRMLTDRNALPSAMQVNYKFLLRPYIYIYIYIDIYICVCVYIYTEC